VEETRKLVVEEMRKLVLVSTETRSGRDINAFWYQQKLVLGESGTRRGRGTEVYSS